MKYHATAYVYDKPVSPIVDFDAPEESYHTVEYTGASVDDCCKWARTLKNRRGNLITIVEPITGKPKDINVYLCF